MDDEKNNEIIIEIPKPPISSLVFEGGGVKGIAYAGAFQALKEKDGFLDHLRWVAGSSAGAMTALMIALDYTPDEIETELTAVNFSEFAQPLPSGKLSTINYILKNLNKISDTIHHGINDGKKLYAWIQTIVEKKLTLKKATFLDLKRGKSKDSESLLKYKNLLVTATNVNTKKIEIFSWETTPKMRLADAILASMSIPGFFYLRFINRKKGRIDWNPTYEKVNNNIVVPYTDGGVLNNYPINKFRSHKYWPPEYYLLAESHEYNPACLGFRVDSKEEVDDFRGMKQKMHSKFRRKSLSLPDLPTQSLADIKLEKSLPQTRKKMTVAIIVSKLLNLIMSDLDKVEQYNPTTIEIEDCGIKTTNFDLTDEDKEKLKESGRKAVNLFYAEFMENNVYERMVYSNLAALKEDYIKIKTVLQTFTYMAYKDQHFLMYILPTLELKKRLIKLKISELNGNSSASTPINYAEASVSGYYNTFFSLNRSINERDAARLSPPLNGNGSQSTEAMEYNQTKPVYRSSVRKFCLCM